MLLIVTIPAVLVTIIIDRTRVFRTLRYPSCMGLYPESNGKLVYAFNQGFNFTRFYFQEIYLAAVCREWMGDAEIRPLAKGPGDRSGVAAGLP